MIRVKKPSQPPAVLRTRGRKATEELCRAFDASPQDYIRGRKTFEFDSSIYGHETVKASLKEAQHDKCCFCESKTSHSQPGDIEHFRPKAGCKQRTSNRLNRPGYYWLAYEWTNLFFSCRTCNHHKQNLFPLDKPSQRARSHHDDVKNEKPLFIDPAADDPTRYIGFREEEPYPIKGSRLGKATIKALGLDRESLAERRREYLRQIKLLKRSRDLLLTRMTDGRLPPDEQALLENIEAELKECVKDSAEYSAMARTALVYMR